MKEENETKEKTISMKEMLERQLHLEEEARVKQESEDWGDEKRCTYGDGYMDQPVFACVDCSKKSGKPFGFCYGCSMNCHVSHNVLELFLKRNFRCDCGTPRSQCSCLLLKSATSTQEDPELTKPNTEPELRSDNDLNQYSHNFKGEYCWCNQPYDHDSDVIMIQCVGCQDWFHEECIRRRNPEIPPPDEFGDFICSGCTTVYPLILLYYSDFSASQTDKKEIQNEKDTTENGSSKKVEEITSPSELTVNNSISCKLTALQQRNNNHLEGRNTFWIHGWRKELCRCASCLELYKAHEIEFLLAEEPQDDESGDAEAVDIDTVEDRTNKRKSTETDRTALLEAAENAFLSTFPRTQQLDFLRKYTELSDNLKTFLAPFAAAGKEVTKQDIDAFFEKMSPNPPKRRKPM